MEDQYCNVICINETSKDYKKKIKSCIYQDPYQIIVPRLNKNSFMIVHVNETGDWEAFLHCHINNDVLTFATGFTRKQNRRQGLSTKLRQYVLINKTQNIRKIESLTMPDSYSDTLLEKMGFIKEGNKMVNYISCDTKLY